MAVSALCGLSIGAHLQVSIPMASERVVVDNDGIDSVRSPTWRYVVNPRGMAMMTVFTHPCGLVNCDSLCLSHSSSESRND